VKRIWLACLLLTPVFVAADERILSFHSDIVIGQDGSMEVTEIIRVRAEGRQIRRGIYRDFPTDYEDRFGNNYHVRFTPLAVLRNDLAEDFNSQKMDNGFRTYFGSADRFIPHGEHTYTFRYEVDRVLGFFEDKDELYWNVTGNGWSFPIDSASATVSFEFDVAWDDFDLYAYTGVQGWAGQDYRVTIDAKARPLFQTARNLGVSEGLTISVAWPKGLVEEPGALQKFTWLLSDNLSLLIVLAGLLLMLIYYLPVWRDHGKDPEPGVLFARYEPPKGFSPASLRYIEQMYYDDTALTAAVVSLAVKGYLRIIEDDDEHSLLRIDPGANPAPLATGEKELHDALFEDGDMVILDDEYHELLGGARSAHERSLKRDYKNRYFKTNGMLNLPALFIGITASIIAFRVSSGSTILIIAMIVLMVLVLIVFAIIMRRPTGLGRRLLDEVGGFKEYMEIAEKDEMNLRNPPHKTPELFEQYLPFALAMGVEQQWGERFAAIFARIKGADGGDYQPSWYKGSWNNFDMSSNTTSLSSGLGTAISSSVTPPGSSSGGGGGGFSGGGGGGGGGGGW
jgi:uncharacterized membrane protein YgcG